MARLNPKVVAIVAGVIIGLLVIKGLLRSSNTATKTMVQQTPVTEDASRDTFVETLNALTVQMQSLQAEQRQLREQQTELTGEQHHHLNELTEELQQRLSDDMQAMQQAMLSQLEQVQTHSTISGVSLTSSPLGRIHDIGRPQTDDEDVINDWLAKLSPSTEQNHLVTPVSHNNTIEEPIKPVYTIPANSTAMDAVLMTTLMGRIPIQGRVIDPYPFKVILGAENLASNGLDIPEVSGIVASGFAAGDLLLKCARGIVTSLTFVFEDGRIQTVEHNSGDPLSPTSALGWLSDPWGNPCLSGKLVTNAPMAVGTKVALGLGQGAMDAIAESQRESIRDDNRSTREMIKNSSYYLMGRAGSQGMSHASDWWDERVQNSFDVIVVPPNQMVAIHFNQSIDIDYNSAGRQLVHQDNL